MIVVLNPEAGGGNALAKWQKIESRVRTIIGECRLVVPRDRAAIRSSVRSGLGGGEADFVAAGGDGTVNAVVAALVEEAGLGSLGHIRLGAVGLGSSNDFHKPFDQVIDGIPVKLNFGATVRHDICLLVYRDGAGATRTRPWIINASIGTTAEANRFFNAPDATLGFLKRTMPGWAIAYAALHTIVTYGGTRVTISLGGGGNRALRTNVRNLGVVKNPHFTGALRYDSPFEPNGGRFWVHVLHGVRLPRVLIALAGLARGRFAGRQGTSSWRAPKLSVESEVPFAVEADGEVVTATRAYFSVAPFGLEVCT